MAAGAWHCPECDDYYPRGDPFNYCPECGTYTVVKSSAEPTVPKDVANARARARDKRAAFEKWLEDNEWDGGRDTVKITIYGDRQRPVTNLERVSSTRIAYMLDELVPFVNGESGPGAGGPVAPLGELHVFDRA